MKDISTSLETFNSMWISQDEVAIIFGNNSRHKHLLALTLADKKYISLILGQCPFNTGLEKLPHWFGLSNQARHLMACRDLVLNVETQMQSLPRPLLLYCPLRFSESVFSTSPVSFWRASELIIWKCFINKSWFSVGCYHYSLEIIEGISPLKSYFCLRAMYGMHFWLFSYDH